MTGLGMIKLGAHQGEDETWHPLIFFRMGNGTEVEFACTSSLKTEAEAMRFCEYLFDNVFRKCGMTAEELLPESGEVIN